jgi:secreted trypsin-like serine protease
MQFSADKRRWILTGIISYGDQCALRDYVGVYTRISVYIDWIKSVVGHDGLVIVEENSSQRLCAKQIKILPVLILLYLTST